MLFLEKESQFVRPQAIKCKVTDYVTREILNRLFCAKKKPFLRGFVNITVTTSILKFLAALSARNTISQSVRPGDRVIFLTRPKPNVSRLRQPGAVRAQP